MSIFCCLIWMSTESLETSIFLLLSFFVTFNMFKHDGKIVKVCKKEKRIYAHLAYDDK